MAGRKSAVLLGNEAIARGAYEAGVTVACAYPGTPSTEILESLALYDGVDAQWSPNEKSALDVVIGAAFCGARALAAMKHVGLNVASDPFMTLSYTGARGGIVVVSCDDPGMHSSQNEQDNRHYARFAKVPMLEPSDSQEAKDFTILGFSLSEQFDTPVLLRSTTRVSHSKSVVQLGPRKRLRRKMHFDRNRPKYVMIPAYAIARHRVVEKRLELLEGFADRAPCNRIQWGSRKLGIVAAGVAYHYAKEVFPDASFLKLGMGYPLPAKLLRKFAGKVKELVVVEELDPFLENEIRALGIRVRGKPRSMRLGELSPTKVRAILAARECAPRAPQAGRPPIMCAGCGYRAVYHVLKKLDFTVAGDIGCYTLGTLPPFGALHTCVSMGGGIGHGFGFTKVLPPEDQEKVAAVIGDSTFIHSGITSLLDLVYNGGRLTVIILDNHTTAMTGRQDHPATGRTLKGDPAPVLDLEAVCRSLGVAHVQTVSAFDLAATEKAIREAAAYEGPSVIISRADCVLVRRREPAFTVSAELCKGCRACLALGCPALSAQDKVVSINALLCTGCSLCAQLCKFGAISRLSETKHNE